MILIQIDADSF